MTTRAEYEARREAVAARMTANPRRFNMSAIAQPSPECGTVCCIAGHTLEEMGAQWRWQGTDLISYRLPDGTDHKWANWALAAAAYLGLSVVDGSSIFLDFSIRDPEEAALRLKSAPYIEEEQ